MFVYNPVLDVYHSNIYPSIFLFPVSIPLSYKYDKFFFFKHMKTIEVYNPCIYP